MKKLIIFNAILILLARTLIATGDDSRFIYTTSLYKRKVAKLTDPERIKKVRPEYIIKLMRIEPGSTVLDIGAGTGMFSLLLSDAVGEKGKVFATDIDPNMVDYIKNVCTEKEINNICPVSVQIGFDQFYSQHSFDIILMSKVYHRILEPLPFLKMLRQSQNENGRLYILGHKIDPDVAEEEGQIEDFKKMMHILTDTREGYPFFDVLDGETKLFIVNWKGEEIPQDIKDSVVSSFNALLSDASLYKKLLSYYCRKRLELEKCFVEECKQDNFLMRCSYNYPARMIFASNVHPHDVSLAYRLIVELDKNMAFEKDAELSDEDKKNVRLLNHILIMGTFGESTTPLDLNNGTNMSMSEESIINTAQKAGYKFIQKHDFSPTHNFLEFSVENHTDKNDNN